MNDMFLDTNIFMYAAGKEHKYKEPCVNILAMIQTGRKSFVTDTEVIQEILYRYHHLGLNMMAHDLSWKVLELVPTIFSVSSDDIKLSLYYYNKYRKLRIPPRDCIHLAVMVDNGLETIVTADRHFDDIEEVERIDPMDFGD